MPYYSIFSNTINQSGFISNMGDASSEAYPYLMTMLEGTFHGKTPISLLFTKYDSESAYPLRYIKVTEESAIYIAFNQKETPFYIGKYLMPYHHGNYEFIYILDGVSYQSIEGNRQICNKDDCYFHRPYTRRLEDYTTDFYDVSFCITRDFMKEIYEDVSVQSRMNKALSIQQNEWNLFTHDFMWRDYTNFYLKEKYRHTRYHLEVRKLVDEIASLLMSSVLAGKRALIKGCLCRLFFYLDNSEYYNIIYNRKEKSAEIFDRIDELMHRSYGQMTRNELEKQMKYSGDYLNKVIKKHTNMNVTQYRNAIIMQHASYLLRYTSKSITEICDELQFSNRTYFYKLFEEVYHVTPREYRKRNTTDQT